MLLSCGSCNHIIRVLEYIAHVGVSRLNSSKLRYTLASKSSLLLLKERTSKHICNYSNYLLMAAWKVLVFLIAGVSERIVLVLIDTEGRELEIRCIALFINTRVNYPAQEISRQVNAEHLY